MAPFSDILGCVVALVGEETFISQKDKQDGTAVRELQDRENV